MLTRSDDDLAEALGHLAGGKLVGSASFEGGVRATKDTLEQSGLSMKGMRLADASGLSSLNELDSATFTHALSVVVANEPFTGSSVGTLWPVSSGLPIAGLTGTLSDRFTSAKTIRGRGVVRAKTGTLTGVIGLAGIVRDSHGRILIFDFDADHAPGPIAAARAAVDRAATIVATN
jgi:D-alanyl-D-alanine carboxypeptidase/D-alanyl-D-alanine-endopeptidase (penicillin-binding protein 4)